MPDDKNKIALTVLKENLNRLEKERIEFLAEIDEKIDALVLSIRMIDGTDEGFKYIEVTHLAGFPDDEKLADEPMGNQQLINGTLIDTVLDVVINKIERFESSTAIANYINDTYGLNKSGESLNRFYIQVSSLLSKWKSKGAIVSFQFSKSKKNNVWGKKDWLENDGTPKKEYFTNPVKVNEVWF